MRLARKIMTGLLGGGNLRYQYSQDFSQDTGLTSWSIPGSGAIADGKLNITPTLGTERIGNPAFSSDFWWVKGAGWSIGSGVASYASGGAAASLDRLTDVHLANTWYETTMDIVSLTAGNFFIYTGEIVTPTRTSTGTHTHSSMRWTTGAMYIQGSAGGNGSIDNVSVKPITFATMLALYNRALWSDIETSVEVTVPAAGEWGGVIVCADSLTAPTNGIIGITNGERAWMLKLVNGTYTKLVDAAITYEAGAKVTVRKLGQETWLYYNDILVGAKQTISDASIINNLYAGILASKSTIGLGNPLLKKVSAVINILGIGDSKTAQDPSYLNNLYMVDDALAYEAPDRIATSGTTVNYWTTHLADELATRTTRPAYVNWDFGANDVQAGFVEATWKADYNSLLDLVEAKWPGVPQYIVRPWRRDYDAECDLLAGYIADIVAARTNTHLGADERVVLKRDDNGVSRTSDGTHPNTLGNSELAEAIMQSMGLLI